MKEYLTCLFACMLVVASISLPVAGQQNNQAGTSVEKLKAKVAKLGVGDKAKATVILKDGKKAKGYIAQVGTDDFVLRDRKTDSPTTIPFNEVVNIESNRGHSTARNIAIGVGIGVGALVAIIAIAFAHLD